MSDATQPRPSQPSSNRPSFHSPGVKFFVICGLTLALMIPLLFVWLLIEDRQSYEEEIVREVAASWGGEQVIAGPFLAVPFREWVEGSKEDKGIGSWHEDLLFVLPEDFSVDLSADVSLRQRAIYEVPVYRAEGTFAGTFPPKGKIDAQLPNAEIAWGETFVAFLVGDMGGLKTLPEIAIGESAVGQPLETGLNLPRSESQVGLHLPLGDVLGDRAVPFSLTLAINGTRSLSVMPLGRESHVALTSNWPHPSFGDGYLPDSRDISGEGFSANWVVPYVARSFPQSWRYSEYDLNPVSGKSVRTGFVQEADNYQLVSRSAKYAILFLATGFLTVFLLETIGRRQVHAVQYVLFGLALVIFYVLLLALSEIVGFVSAYVMASAAVAGLNGAYISAVFASRKQGAIVTLSLLVLYMVLYVVLQVAAYALLVGAVLAFGVLGVTMYATRNVEWSGAHGEWKKLQT